MFDSALKWMSVIIEAKNNKDRSNEAIVVCKGAPEVIEKHLHLKPPAYEAHYREFVKSGYWVLALAYKIIKDRPAGEASIKSLKWDECEKDLEFAGFLIFECPIKKSSWKIVKELKGSDHLVKMITGDNILTAAHVAKEV